MVSVGGSSSVGIVEHPSARKGVHMKRYKTRFEELMVKLFGWALWLSVNS